MVSGLPPYYKLSQFPNKTLLKKWRHRVKTWHFTVSKYKANYFQSLRRHKLKWNCKSHTWNRASCSLERKGMYHTPSQSRDTPQLLLHVCLLVHHFLVQSLPCMCDFCISLPFGSTSIWKSAFFICHSGSWYYHKMTGKEEIDSDSVCCRLEGNKGRRHRSRREQQEPS